VVLLESELPVIGSFDDDRNWLILTTDRLAWSRNGKRFTLPVKDIRDARMDLHNFPQMSRDMQARQLRIVTMAGQEHLVDLEPGYPLGGTWSVLRNVGSRNRNARERLS
jgi:hypothetical protein